MREIDIDDFGLDAFPLDEPPAPEPRRDPAVEAAIVAEREAMAQAAQAERSAPTKDATPVRSHLRGLIYESRSGGGPHIVTLHELPTQDGRGYEQAVLCICEAMRNLARRPQGCWAMQDAREVFGLAAIGGEHG